MTRFSRAGAWRIAAAGAGCAGAAALALGLSTPAPAGTKPLPERPNVVLVMTDDQTVEQMRAMPQTKSLIGDQGTTFENSFTSFPLCCPSRATFLTGQHAHNHKVMDNAGPMGGFDRLRGDETLPVWLQRAGYLTAQVGKFMNGYELSPVGVPPGWNEWHGMKTLDHYYGYDLNENGVLVRYGSPNENPDDPKQPETYTTDVFTGIARELIVLLAPQPNPFFLWVSYNAPHSGRPEPPPGGPSRCRGNAKPAERHIGAFEAAQLPATPSINEADVSDKPPSVREIPPLTPGTLAAIRNFYRCELESLLAVDEGVERIVEALAATGELDDTVIIFTSDNGFFHGEHRIPQGKYRFYEESLRVPLLVRGPGVPAGAVVDEPVSNVSLAPTVLDLAGAEAGVPQDERSLLPLVAKRGRDRGREILLDTFRYRGVHTERFVYVRHIRGPDEGFRELYDLARDPHQLTNLARDSRYRDERRALRKRVRVLKRCRGEECHTRPRLRLVEPQPPDRGGGGNPGAARRCRRIAHVEIDGRDGKRLRNVAFRLGRKPLRTDQRQPFRVGIPRKRLARPKRIHAQATLVDGRQLTLRRRIRC